MHPEAPLAILASTTAFPTLTFDGYLDKFQSRTTGSKKHPIKTPKGLKVRQLYIAGREGFRIS